MKHIISGCFIWERGNGNENMQVICVDSLRSDRITPNVLDFHANVCFVCSVGWYVMLRMLIIIGQFRS